MEILTTSLDNGLTIVGEPQKWCNGVSVGFFVKTGARDEVASESGVSHFLEHMAFKGTPSRSAFDINNQFGNIGAKANAFTSSELTVYYGTVVADNLYKLLDVLADIMRPSLRKEDFDMEKNVILEEIALYKDKPHFDFFDQLERSYFKDHPCGNSILGTTESIKALTLEQMQDYFNRRYSASNIVLAISGNFDWDSFVKAVEARCSEWSTQDVSRTMEDFKREPESKTFYRKNLTQSMVALVFRGTSIQRIEDTYNLSVLSMILGGGRGSKAFWELVDTGIAEYAGISADCMDGVGTIYAYGSTRPKDIETVSSKLKEILSSPLNFTDKELEKAKSRYLASVVLSGEGTMSRMRNLGHAWHSVKQTFTIEDIINRVKAVTKDTIIDTVGRYPFCDWSEYKLLPEE